MQLTTGLLFADIYKFIKQLGRGGTKQVVMSCNSDTLYADNKNRLLYKGVWIRSVRFMWI